MNTNLDKPISRVWGYLLGRIPLTFSVSLAALLAFYLPSYGQLMEIQFDGGYGISTLSLFGCHLLHWSDQHLFWDLGMFIVLSVVCEQRMPHRFYGTLLVSAILVPVTVGIVHPEIDVYRGLSGLDTAIFSLLATSVLIDGVREREFLKCSVFAVWLLVWLKTLYELLSGGTLFVQNPEFVPLPVAHLVGSLVGLMAACLGLLGKLRRPWLPFAL